MALFQIGNEQITIQVDSMGAELKSLKKTTARVEYMWGGSPEFWKRTSPVLFPVVGGLREGKYVHNGRVYSMGQHGFARDMEFTLKSQTNKEIWFSLKSDEKTLEMFPYEFVLELGYELCGSTVIVKWKVFCPSEQEMYFSIGGHPAFRCPLAEGAKQSDYRLWFDADKVTAGILRNGLMSNETAVYTLENGCMWITGHLFDNDALVIENNQAHKVSLVKPDGSPYLTVSFDAPLFGIWSPPGKNAPFVCIEPWYGRCDAKDFSGTWEERKWGQYIAAGESFEASYQITV